MTALAETTTLAETTAIEPAPEAARPSGAARLRTLARRAARGTLHRMSGAGLILYALALGAGLGLASADYATRGGYPFGGVAIGAWTAWPRVGSASADPYTRAVHARRGEIPLAVGEGLLVTTSSDDTGRSLDAACTYVLGGVTPPARAWTLTIAGRGPADPDRAPMREGFTSTEVLRAADGRFAVTISPDPQPGNWLPMPRPKGPVRLALRLYDTPAAASVGTLDRDTLPAITRAGCRS